MIRYGLMALAILAALGLLAGAAMKYHNSVYRSGYDAGFAACNTLALAAAEKKRIADQTKIDDIRKRADAEIAARTSSNVKKAIEDARKADPRCKLTVPGTVLDQLRGPR